MDAKIQSTQQDVQHLAEAGDRVYEEKIKAEVEPQMAGKYLAIDPETGDWFAGDTIMEADEQARKKYPHKVFFLKRVGFRAVFHLHGFRGLTSV
ncbi:MAG: hypothetical protein AB1352_05155 [Patescibacteria group bacterium]